jgi:hypothetical protein
LRIAVKISTFFDNMQPQSLSPVSKVLLWKNAESKESIHSLEMRLQHKFYAKKLAKKWSASVKMYRQTVHTETEDRTSMLLLQLGISECVWIMDQQHIVQTDASMERIVNTLKNQWSMRQAIFIEGSEWSMGDVVVRLGNVMLGNAFQGVLILVPFLVHSDGCRRNTCLVRQTVAP